MNDENFTRRRQTKSLTARERSTPLRYQEESEYEKKRKRAKSRKILKSFKLRKEKEFITDKKN